MKRSIGLYLHIPFCDGKCYYCNFFSERHNDAFLSEYTEHMKRMIRLWSERLDRSVRTVYFGGGTPSVLGHDRLADILNTIRDCFEVHRDAEITVEVNPSGTDTLDFSVLREAGFNRLSIGMQSADNHELKLLGRLHTVGDVTRTIESAQAAGFDNISLDVMLAIPDQTIDSLEDTMSYCAARGVQHISAYILKVEEGTRFFRKYKQLHLFDDDAQAAFYEYTVDRLKELGYDQYEISNFAQIGHESRHNLVYWHDEEYLGLGPSAHSYLDGKRFYYPSNFDDFFTDNTCYEGSGGDPQEYIMLALRLTEGLNFERYRERYGEAIGDHFYIAAQKLSKNGLVKLTPSSLSLTTKGFLVSNAVIGYLLEST